jgi:hypothetical protein
MASNQRKTLRFAVGTPEEYRSAIWRLWVQGDDVYLATRTMTQFIKLSLHRSGIWRLAWTEESSMKAQGSYNRVEQRWQRPAEFRLGWTQGPAVIVPNSGIWKPFQRALDQEKIPVHWSSIPQPGQKYHFTVLFARSQAPQNSWQTVVRSDDSLLGVLDLRNGDKIVLHRREIPMVEKESSYVHSFVQNMRIHCKADAPEICEASVFTAGTDDAGYPYLLDMSLGWENVRGPNGMMCTPNKTLHPPTETA